MLDKCARIGVSHYKVSEAVAHVACTFYVLAFGIWRVTGFELTIRIELSRCIVSQTVRNKIDQTDEPANVLYLWQES